MREMSGRRRCGRWPVLLVALLPARGAKPPDMVQTLAKTYASIFFKVGDAPQSAHADELKPGTSPTSAAMAHVDTGELAVRMLREENPWTQHKTHATRCTTALHGCPSLADRNTTLAVAQHCLWTPRAALTEEMRATCDGERFASKEAPNRPVCGFTSEPSLKWLQFVRAAAEGCTRVIFAVVLGGYDSLKEPPGRLRPGTCLIAISDLRSLASWGFKPSTTKEIARSIARPTAPMPRGDAWPYVYSQWRVVLLPIRYYPKHASRLSKTLRFAGMRMFPDAQTVMYADGKLNFIKSLDVLMDYFANHTSLAWVALAHNNKTRNAVSEVDAAKNRFGPIESHASSTIRQKVAAHMERVERQRAFYKLEDGYNNAPGLIDGGLFIQQREPRAAPSLQHSGIQPPDHRTVLRWLDCVQQMEMMFFSDRTQLSWTYLIDRLGAHRHVYFMSLAEKLTFVSPKATHSLSGFIPTTQQHSTSGHGGSSSGGQGGGRTKGSRGGGHRAARQS